MKTRFLHIGREFGHDVQCTKPIVDIETTGNVRTSTGRNEYQKADICCVGMLVGDQIIQIHREPGANDTAQFKRETISHIGSHPIVHAFNRDFEYYALTSYLDIDSIYVYEIKPFKGRGWTKDRFFEELVSDGIVKTRVPIDPFHGDSTLVFPSWASGDIKSILDHNVVCLLKEYHILENQKYLYDKYSRRINEDGWYQTF
jgi:hypothetical protein